jgi:formylglycine-generating enzyme required for sulfatase activity
MSGNALEWCHDWYNKNYYRNSPTENPKGPELPTQDSAKVVRGGTWAYVAKFSRNGYRTKFKSDVFGGSIGFRVCRVNK